MRVQSPLRWLLTISVGLFVLSDDVRSLLQIEDDVVLSSELLLHSDNQEFVLLLGETS